MNQSTKLIQKLKQRDKERQHLAITKWGGIEKSSILLSQYWKKLPALIDSFSGFSATLKKLCQ